MVQIQLARKWILIKLYLNSYNKYVYSVQGKRYSNFKKTWKKLDGQTVRLKQILDKNGAPAPKSNYYFPYQKYSDNLWKLLDNLPDL